METICRRFLLRNRPPHSAVLIARFARRIGGNGNRKFILSGFSTGVPIGYGLVNQEAQLPPGRRNVGGFIPIDYNFKEEDPEFAQEFCGYVAEYEELLQIGEYAGYSWMLELGEPANTAPDDSSTIVPGLTNLEAALTIFSSPTSPPHPAHFFAGIFDESGTATGLQYTDLEGFLDFLIYSPPYQTLYALERDQCMIICPQMTTPWDTHLGNVTVPILHVCAAGGYGTPYDPTLELVGSQDVTTLYVSLHPEDERELDYGHVDLFAADNAPELVWQPILEWVLAHTH